MFLGVLYGVLLLRPLIVVIDSYIGLPNPRDPISQRQKFVLVFISIVLIGRKDLCRSFSVVNPISSITRAKVAFFDRARKLKSKKPISARRYRRRKKYFYEIFIFTLLANRQRCGIPYRGVVVSCWWGECKIKQSRSVNWLWVGFISPAKRCLRLMMRRTW